MNNLDRLALVAGFVWVAWKLSNLGKKMSEISDQIASIETTTTALGEAVLKEVQQLEDALEDDGDIEENVTRLKNIGTALTGFVSKLNADDVPAVVESGGEGDGGNGEVPAGETE